MIVINTLKEQMHEVFGIAKQRNTELIDIIIGSFSLRKTKTSRLKLVLKQCKTNNELALISYYFAKLEASQEQNILISESIEGQPAKTAPAKLRGYDVEVQLSDREEFSWRELYMVSSEREKELGAIVVNRIKVDNETMSASVRAIMNECQNLKEVVLTSALISEYMVLRQQAFYGSLLGTINIDINGV